jgi:glycosyltransferase involved in cell wall biosynthesis
MNIKSICHLTSVHSRHDVRIFFKQCRSLATAGYRVFLVVADGKKDQVLDGVKIFDAGVCTGRLDRIIMTTRRVLAKAVELDADIYHLHDPELLPVGLQLKRTGKIVVFDSHEDVPQQLLSKPYLNKELRWLASRCWSVYQAWVCRQLDGIIAATPFIRNNLKHANPNTVDVCNYPIVDEFGGSPVDWGQKKEQVCYVGGISLIRGIREMVRAVEMVQGHTRLVLGGNFFDQDLRFKIKQYPGWSRTEELGFLDRNRVKSLLCSSVAGLVVLHPKMNYVQALPIKMFEYMSAGIPVIASDFPAWEKILRDNDCGLCVDPLDPKAIAQAIDFIITNPDRAEQMGKNGQRAVQERYNWNSQNKKLLEYYSGLLNE